MDELFLGTVIGFKKLRGFGYIKPDESDFGEKVFCHWKTIKTSNKWPTLTDGMRVAFQVEQDEKKPNNWKTTEVYTEDGEEINAKEEIILLNKGKKYRGTCKSYNKGRGTGFITPDGNGPWSKTTGVKVLRADINGDGGTPFLKPKQRVQFQLTKEGAGFRALNVTLPGGKKIPTESASGRSTEESDKSAGKKKAVKKQIRKRKLSPVIKNKNPSTKKPVKKKKNNCKQPMKRAEITSGVYGGMEVDAEDVIEIGILLRSHWVGSLIGKKGATIKEIRKLSDANMKFGDDEIEHEGGLYKVFAISGTMNQVADACKVIAVKLGEASQTLEYKIVFLVPDSYCGMFVGKKGSTIKEIRGEMDLRVRVVLSQDPVQLPGSSKVTLCTVFGPRENVKDAIERTVAVLGGISTRLKRQMMEPMQQWGDNRWDGGHRGNPREIGGWNQGGRRGTADWGQTARRGRGRSRGRGRR